MRMILRIFTILMVLGFVIPKFPAVAAVPQSKAEQKLMKYLGKVLPKRGLSMDCVTLIEEDEVALCYQYAIQERHGNGCPGDPETSPIVDRYRIGKNNLIIRHWNPINDTWKRVY